MLLADDQPDDTGEFLFYQTDDAKSRIQLRLHDGNVWLTQRQLSDLYQVSLPTVNEHLATIYDEGELSPEATIRKFRIVQSEGNRQVSRLVDHYRLEAILSIGYRVRSQRGVQFRRWATSQLQELLVKGFVMDDERLKEGRHLGTDYFDELLERIRDIRASEKRFYQKIRDLYKLSIDYDKDSDETQLFFQIVQNKLHFAITGKTAAEIIEQRADSTQPNMGLTAWKGSKVRKADVTGQSPA
ncbi:MAG: virulence RhuM family protein [Pirellula sp.]|nr:virulence RhuM family protein [Pirellula sp.]